MSLQNAINFLKRVDSEPSFRGTCYTLQSESELLEWLKSEKLVFNSDEMEEVFNMLLFKCQTQEQADKINELKAWWRVMVRPR